MAKKRRVSVVRQHGGVDGEEDPMKRLFTKGYPYTVTHGQVVLPEKTHRGALRRAVIEAKQWDVPVHVLERSRKEATIVATCVPQTAGRKRIVRCYSRKKPARKT